MAELKPGQWNSLLAPTEAPRLDSFLALYIPTLSRSRAQKLIDEGHVKISGQSNPRASSPVAAGDTVEIFLPAPKALGLRAENIPLEILFQDEHLAVIEKPAGLVVHPGAGHEEGTLVNALLHHFTDLSRGAGIGGELRPGIVHRIDRNTSGILLVTKTDLAHQHLSAQFKEHSITRRYQGLCWGALPSAGEWDMPIARDPKERKRMAVVPGGRRALTRFRRLANFAGLAAAFEAELFTGRTHQIRVHFSAHGFPLAGDSIYTQASAASRRAHEQGARALAKRCPNAAAALEKLHRADRQFLHAAHLGFRHPVSGEVMGFDSPLPNELATIMVELTACHTP